MAIKILSPQEFEQLTKQAQAVSNPLIFANPKNIYKARVHRLNELAKDNPMADYLLFTAQICDILDSLQDEITIIKLNSCELKPLDCHQYKRDPIWIEILNALIDKMKPFANETVLSVIETLEKSSHQELEDLATNLLNNEFEKVGSDKAIFLWSALSFYWVNLTTLISHNALMESSDGLDTCPVCDAPPVSGVIQYGQAQGLRYLHCSLCETKWNVVRAKCSNCQSVEQLDYWAIDNKFAEIRAESCGDCKTYLKMLYLEKTKNLDPVADDLASIYLDLEMGDKDFARSGLNPFIFGNIE